MLARNPTEPDYPYQIGQSLLAEIGFPGLDKIDRASLSRDRQSEGVEVGRLETSSSDCLSPWDSLSAVVDRPPAVADRTIQGVGSGGLPEGDWGSDRLAAVLER